MNLTARGENRHVDLVASLVGCVCLIAFFTGLGPSQALAQRGRARRILDEAQAHEEAQRYAIAAQRYLQLYDVMTEAELPRAPVALWSAGFCLSHVAGREQDARDTLRRFLEASVPLAQEPDIQGFRSESVSIISELEARAPQSAGQELGEPSTDSRTSTTDDRDRGVVSPIGPILLAVGGAALIPGLITIGLAYGQDQDIIARCPARMACDSGTRSEAEAARDLGLAGDALWIVGASIALVALVGLVLTFVLKEGGEGRSARSSLRFESTTGGGIASIAWRVP